MRIEHNFTKATEAIRDLLTKQTPFATSVAVNRSLSKTRDHIKSEMDNYIEGGPTPFTRNGMRVFPTSVNDMRGGIVFVAIKGDRDKTREYMQELMKGGEKKAFRRKLPEPEIENLKRFAPSFFTARGNIKRSFYKQARNKGNKKYFIGAPKRGKGHWPSDSMYGIWKRDKENGRLHIMVYLSRPKRRQRQTFPAPEIAENFFTQQVRAEFRDAYALALKTARF